MDERHIRPPGGAMKWIARRISSVALYSTAVAIYLPVVVLAVCVARILITDEYGTEHPPFNHRPKSGWQAARPALFAAVYCLGLAAWIFGSIILIDAVWWFIVHQSSSHI